MKKFESFISDNKISNDNWWRFDGKGKLFIESDDESFNDWKLTINISKLWESYSNNEISLIEFNKQYAKELLNQQKNIIKHIGKECWYEIRPLIFKLENSTDINDSIIIYNDLYDIFDKYEIYIKCENK